MIFSPSDQISIWDVQTKIREIDMALFPSLKNFLGADQTFVYSTLAGACAFAGLENLGTYSPEIQKFASEVVIPVIEECFSEIKKFNYELNNSDLKFSILKKFDRIQFYPEKIEFKAIDDKKLISQLKKVINTGIYTLYKLNDQSDKYYGGRIDISQDAFLETAKILEQNGYKKDGDIMGSSFDLKGHITTIDPKELAQNYETIVSAHDGFVKSSQEVSIEPVSIKIGSPQAGRMSRILAINVNVANLEKYREACKLGHLRFLPHLSVFSQEIRPLAKLNKVKILDFTNQEDNKFLIDLHSCFKKNLK